jgi:hypothetical protein
MAKNPQTQLEQLDTKDELLDFDLDDLSGDDNEEEDEVIELVELIESDKDEDGTRELTVNGRTKEKSGASTAKADLIVDGETSVKEEALLEDEEESDLDLSDLTLDMDMETVQPVQRVEEGEITEADLENLLQGTSDEEITFDLLGEKDSVQQGKDEEVTDADLEALLAEATTEGTGESEEEVEVLEIISAPEAEEEIQLERESPSLADIEVAGDSFEKTQIEAEPLAEKEAPVAVQEERVEPAAPEEPAPSLVAVGEPSADQVMGISGERLEQIITKVVEDVVERVARETMASVAERVIGQAIEALKASLEKSSEEP